MTKLAIVILNYNGERHLREFLPSVLEHSQTYQVHVVDNASTDGSISTIETEFLQVKLHQLESNLGFSAGYNRALASIEAEYYVILNSDVKVTPGWIDPLLTLLESDQSIAAVQPKILSYNTPDHFEYAGAGGGYIDLLGYPFCRGRIFTTIEKDQNQYDDTKQVFWASGACLFIRSKSFHEVSGFDEDFFAHMEEIDLCWRIQHTGQKIFYCGQSVVYHLGGGTLSRINPYKTYLNFSNSLSMLVKNDQVGQLIWKLPVRAVLDIVAAIKFSLFDSISHGQSVIKAHWNFWRKLRYIIKKRKKALEKVSASEPDTIYRHSIVFSYFVKGYKVYGDLKKAV